MDFKRFIPHAAAIVIFALVAAIFFSPAVFGDKRIAQSDVYHFSGAAKEIKDYREKTGKEPLWTNSMFGGMPAYQISVLYPSNLVQYIQTGFQKVIPFPATVTFICFLSFYMLLVTLRLNPWVSIAGAIAFGFSSFFIIILQVGHNTQAYAIAYMPAVLAGVLMTMRGRLWLGTAVTAIALALELNANHLQITYYLLLIIVLIGIGEVIRMIRENQKDYLVKAIGGLLAAAFVAILPNLTNLYLTNEYGKDSTRGKSELTLDSKNKSKTSGLDIDYALQYSYGVGESMTLMVPDFNGGASQRLGEYDESAMESVDGDAQIKKWVADSIPSYFGGQGGTQGPVYVGAIVCFLFLLGLLIVRDSIKWWLLAATVLSLMLAWGHNFEGFSRFFLNNIPGYNKFRAVSMILVIAEVTMPLMGMLALRELINNPNALKENMRSLYIAFGVTGGLCFLIYIMPTMFVSPMPKESEDTINYYMDQAQITAPQDRQEVIMIAENARLAVVQSDAIRSFGLILVAAVLVFFYARKPYGIGIFAAAMIVLMLIDMYPVAGRYLSEDKNQYEKIRKGADEVEQTEADKIILADTDPDYRVLNISREVNYWSDASTSYWHKSIGGYHGAKLKRIQELFDMQISKQVQDAFKGVSNDSGAQAGLAKQGVLNMLNTKYVIYDSKGGVVRNQSACGSVWFVQEIKQVANADEEMTALNGFNPKRTAVVDKRFESQLSGFAPHADSTASIKLVSYEPNDLKYESNASSEQVAVFSEIYYDKGWNAYVDGELKPHFRADYVLRAMRVPAGKHTIEFKFEPSFYNTGEKIALVGSLLLFIFFGGAIYLDWKKRKNNPDLVA